MGTKFFKSQSRLQNYLVRSSYATWYIIISVPISCIASYKSEHFWKLSKKRQRGFNLKDFTYFLISKKIENALKKYI